jgi:tyrosinase
MMLLLKDGTKQPIGHDCASFPTWHRAFLKDFEEDLQSFDHEVTLPYWDW